MIVHSQPRLYLWYLWFLTTTLNNKIMNSITIDRKLENKPFITPAGTHLCVDDIIEVTRFTTVNKSQNRLKFPFQKCHFPVEPVLTVGQTQIMCWTTYCIHRKDSAPTNGRNKRKAKSPNRLNCNRLMPLAANGQSNLNLELGPNPFQELTLVARLAPLESDPLIWKLPFSLFRTDLNRSFQQAIIPI